MKFKRIILGLIALVLVVGGPLAQAQTPDAGWAAIVIRGGATGLPLIADNDDYVVGALEFTTTEGGQKAGLGTNLLNGTPVSGIVALHVDRLDDVANSGSLWGPYFNIWVTDGAGKYAVIANEPSNPEWDATNRWNIQGWDVLRTKTCKVYETPGASTGTSWVHDLVGSTGPLTFEDVGSLVIEPPSQAYILDGANAVGTGAPDELGTNIAYGYTWVFGDTAANYVTGGDGFIVDNYYAWDSYPVQNTDQGTEFLAIQPALDAANPNDAITVAAGHYEGQLHVTVPGVSVTGAGVGATFIDCPPTLTLSFTTSAANFPVVFVDGVEGVAFANLTLDGLGRGNANYRFQGFGFNNGGGSLTNVSVLNVMDTPFSGAQHGVGVYCNADDGGPHAFTMTDVLVEGFQKTAVAINGAGIDADLLRVTTTGAGPTDVTAQNGLQVGYGAVTDAVDCLVTGMDYTGADWSASGVLSVADGIANFDGCDIDACQTSVYFSDGGGSFNNGTVTNPTGDAMYAYSSGAKAVGDNPPRPAQPFDITRGKANKAAITVSIDGSTFTGAGAVDSWGPTAYGYGPINFTIDNSTVTNWDYGVVIYDFGGLDVTAQGAGNTLSGNLSYGAYSNAPGLADLRNNNWGDASGPLHAAQNPLGLGDGVSDAILYIPWIGRTVGVVADLGATPTGAFFWEGTPAIGVDGDFAAGFDPGAIQAPSAYSKYGFDPEAIFGREVLTGELYKISYFTKKGTTHVAPDPVGDWFMQFYTDPYDGSPGGSWYGHRINSEPYFSADLVETAGEWTAWQTEAGVDNRLRFFDSSDNYYGSYTDGFLSDLAADPVIAPQPIMIMGLGLGTAWAAGFDGLLDGLTIELVSGETMRLNFLSGNAVVTATPATSGPFNCSESQVVTFGVELTDDMPDMFLYNAVVRATSEVSFGPVEDLFPFGTMNNNFYALDNGDGSWTITGSTVGSPTYPVTAPGTADLFSIEFLAETDGTAAITFDSLVLRDPENATIPVVMTGATIEVDCTVPNAVTGITASPHHNKVEVAWVHDGLDVDHYLVYHGVWYDGTPGVSAYPEYDDLVGFGVPIRPAAGLPDPGQGWIRVDGDAVIHPVDSFFDVFVQIPDDLQRGVYAYEVYAVDAAGNVSAPAAANDHATNYWLGDMNGDGAVNATYDISVLGAAFGETQGDDDYNPFCDVGPTDDWSRVGIPTTDNKINFEDLMVFSMNFGVVSSTNKVMGPISTNVGLEWVSAGENRYALRLVDGEGVKGVRVRANLDEGAAVDVSAGDLLDGQDEMTFLRNLGTGLDACVTVMGRDTGFVGTGDLMFVDGSTLLTMSDLTIDARGHDNSKLKVSLTASTDKITPRVFALNANYPNPFNPMTKISFSLPEAQDVRLTVYGVDGTRVATLINETRASGLHEVLWMGRDDAGKALASGTYFYRIDAGPYSQVRKMVLMK